MSGPVPAKLAPKAFKAIPDDAPAKELGEYLRAMIRAADVSLDRVAAAGEMAKNTLTTTMDGRSKEWPSIQNWITAYSKAAGVELYARQIDDIRRLYQLGRRNHLAALRAGRTGKPAAGATELGAGATPATAAAVAAATAAGDDLPVLESLLVEVAITLPRRIPGAGIDAQHERFLDHDEIEANVAAMKREALLRRLQQGPVRVSEEPNTWFTPVDYGPWATVYLSTNAAPGVQRSAPLTPVAQSPVVARVPVEPSLVMLLDDLPIDLLSEPCDCCEPTTGAPAGAGQLAVDLGGYQRADDDETWEAIRSRLTNARALLVDPPGRRWLYRRPEASLLDSDVDGAAS